MTTTTTAATNCDIESAFNGIAILFCNDCIWDCWCCWRCYCCCYCRCCWCCFHFGGCSILFLFSSIEHLLNFFHYFRVLFFYFSHLFLSWHFGDLVFCFFKFNEILVGGNILFILRNILPKNFYLKIWILIHVFQRKYIFRKTL